MKHFTITELTRSHTAQRLNIPNIPSQQAVDNLHRLVEQTLDPARQLLGIPIIVNSGYRSPRLNKAVGGAPRSYHLQGRAADITAGTVDDNRRLFKILSNLSHTELIWEQNGAWIHVAL